MRKGKVEKIQKLIAELIKRENSQNEEEFSHNLAKAIRLSMEIDNVSLALDIKMAYDCTKKSHPAPKRDVQAHLKDALAHL